MTTYIIRRVLWLIPVLLAGSLRLGDIELVVPNVVVVRPQRGGNRVLRDDTGALIHPLDDRAFIDRHVDGPADPEVVEGLFRRIER